MGNPGDGHEVIVKTAGRILSGVLFGYASGLVLGPVIGALAGLLMGTRTIFLMEPLDLPNTALAVIIAMLMLPLGLMLGGLAG